MKKLLLTRAGFQLMMGDTQLKVKLLFSSWYGTVAYHGTIKTYTRKTRKVSCAASALSPLSLTLPFRELPSPSEPETRSLAPRSSLRCSRARGSPAPPRLSRRERDPRSCRSAPRRRCAGREGWKGSSGESHGARCCTNTAEVLQGQALHHHVYTRPTAAFPYESCQSSELSGLTY